MKKATLIIMSAAAMMAATLNATQVSFAAEAGSVSVGGGSVTDGNDLTWLGFFVDAASFGSFIANPAFGQSESVDVGRLGDIKATLSSASGGSFTQFTPTPLAQTPSFGYLNTVADPNNPIDSGSAGNHAVLVVFDAANIEAIAEGSNVGVVATTSQTNALGNFTVDFSGANLWDTTLVGQSGSLSLASVVPEPSTFALIAGCFGLALAMVRRRRV